MQIALGRRPISIARSIALLVIQIVGTGAVAKPVFNIIAIADADVVANIDIANVDIDIVVAVATPIPTSTTVRPTVISSYCTPVIFKQQSIFISFLTPQSWLVRPKDY